MSYTPSEAAVDWWASLLWEWSDSDGIAWEDVPQAERRLWEQRAAKILVSWSGAAVPAEPCATCHGDEEVPWRDGEIDLVACPDCPSPRSLPVVECEAAGLLTNMPRLEASGPLGKIEGMTFYAVVAAPSTGSPT